MSMGRKYGKPSEILFCQVLDINGLLSQNCSEKRISLTRKRDVAQAEMAKKNKHNAITETESTHVFAFEMD